VVALTSVFSILGGIFALAIASFTTLHNLNWRTAFWFGGGVAIIGVIARTTLKETTDFADAKRWVKNILGDLKKDLESNPIWRKIVEKNSDRKNIIALFFMDCA
jgi:MFS family permease